MLVGAIPREFLVTLSPGRSTGQDPAVWGLYKPRTAHPTMAHPQSFPQLPVGALPSVLLTFGKRVLQMDSRRDH